MLTNFEIETSFINKEELMKMLDDFEGRLQLKVNSLVDEDGNISPNAVKSTLNQAKQQISTKLNVVFNRQIQLTFDEAYTFYNSSITFLQERVNILYDVIDRLNEMDIVYTPTKMVVASFFRVSCEVFDMLMDDANVEPMIQKIFIEINNFILSITQTALETGATNSYAWQRLQLKSKFGGNEIEAHKEKTSQTTIIVANDIQKKLKAEYNFEKFIEDSKNEDKKEEA